MTRIRFENSPSTNTPINASNLDKLNNVVVSSTEPTTGEEVWIQRGKNYFNYDGEQPDTTFTEKVTINNEKAFKKIAGTNHIWAIFHLDECDNKLKENEKYTISFDIWADKNTSFANSSLLYVNSLTNTKHNLSNITTQKQKLMATFTYKKSNSLLHIYPTHVEGNILYISNVQIEQGESATSYEPYVDKKIYTKNDNGVYEEFYKSDIVESGSNSNGNWVKFADGRMECFGELLYENIAITNEDYNTYYAQLEPKPFPQVFKNNPITVMQVDSVAPAYALWLRSSDTGASTTQTNKLLVTSAASCTANKIKIHYHAKGYWK